MGGRGEDDLALDGGREGDFLGLGAEAGEVRREEGAAGAGLEGLDELLDEGGFREALVDGVGRREAVAGVGVSRPGPRLEVVDEVLEGIGLEGLGDGDVAGRGEGRRQDDLDVRRDAAALAEPVGLRERVGAVVSAQRREAADEDVLGVAPRARGALEEAVEGGALLAFVPQN